jgi:hypothetical protein
LSSGTLRANIDETLSAAIITSRAGRGIINHGPATTPYAGNFTGRIPAFSNVSENRLQKRR